MKNDVMSQGTPDMGIEGTDKKEQPTPQSVTPAVVNTSTCLSQLPIPLLSPSPPTTSTPLMATPASLRSTSFLWTFAHMQSHVHLPASHLPPGTLLANNNERSTIPSLIKEE
ncbi:hypothetical protein AX14_009909 [Amanita brunnescens Koide BX004]|nr:hypothetical protein AX14_009909 [Amanita brunnescens Koide BX004]